MAFDSVLPCGGTLSWLIRPDQESLNVNCREGTVLTDDVPEWNSSEERTESE